MTEKSGAHSFKHKTELKKKFDEEHKLKFTATSSDYELDYEFSPESLNKDGVESSLEVKGKYVPAKEDWEGSAEFKVGGFELGPIKPFTEIQLDSNKGKEHSLTYGQNLVYEKDYHCAWKLTTDFSKLTSAYGLLALMNTSKGNFYFRSNCLNNFVGLGCSYTI